jgi:hypothetical protein
VAGVLKARISNSAGAAIVGNGSANTSVAGKLLSKLYVTAAKLAYATIHEMLEAVFSMRLRNTAKKKLQEEMVSVRFTLRLYLGNQN